MKSKITANRDNCEEIYHVFRELGQTISLLHSKNIIHGDLTTSNIMINLDRVLYLIDFGLSQIKNSVEEKAIDLYIFEKSIICDDISVIVDKDKLIQSFIEGYKESSNFNIETLKRLDKVKQRGRKRVSIG